MGCELALWVPSSTRADLVRAAADQGFRVTDRLIVDWTARGLLDQPRGRPGLGQGKGWDKGTWPWGQRQLFLLLLRKRDELQAHPRADFRLLYNVPVALWLWFGDAYVPIRQVRRVLGTWLRGETRLSKENASTRGAIT